MACLSSHALVGVGPPWSRYTAATEASLAASIKYHQHPHRPDSILGPLVKWTETFDQSRLLPLVVVPNTEEDFSSVSIRPMVAVPASMLN